MSPELTWSGHTDRGRLRPNNEDVFLALTFDAEGVRYCGKVGSAPLAGGDFVFAVSDGMGGENRGEFASRIAVDNITLLLPRHYRRDGAGEGDGPARACERVLCDLFHAIHASMTRLGRGYAECANMGATLTLAWFQPGWICFGHAGDSRLYHLPRGGPLLQLTHDHTHPGWLRRTGRINEREARSHPQRSALNKALGAGHQFIDPQCGAVPWVPGDTFLLCTDGVIDGLWDHTLAEILSAPPVPDAPGLVARAVADGSRDNVTAVIVRCG